MLQLLHRDHARHMTLLLSSAEIFSSAPRNSDIQDLRPIPGGRRSYAGGVHLLLPPLGALIWFVRCVAVALGSWFGAGHGADVTGYRAAVRGMCG